jgi:putative transposase
VDITYLPMRRGFLYLVAIIDWFTRKVLAWRISNTLEADFCVEALNEAVHKFGVPEIMNSDQGSQFTSFAWTDRLRRMGVRISMDGKGRFLDNIFVERLWRTLKYECVYLHAWETGSQAGHEGEPFYPHSLERGRRSVRAVMLAVAEMYIKGVLTREAEAVMREFGIESLSSTQVSRATKLLDEELEAWRNRPLGECRYLILDARYEKARVCGVVRDVAVLSAVGIGPDERRRVLGVSVALSEAEVHWRDFLRSLHARGLRGVEYIVSDDHAGLQAARRAVFGAAQWQRCQFHLAQNAIHHAPSVAIRKCIGTELRAVWNAGSLAKAETALAELVSAYRDTAPKLAAWLEKAAPEGLAVFALPEHHRRRMRTSNPMERGVQQELKRRTIKVRVFPNEAALERLVSAVLVEIDDKWAADTKAYIKWECQDA